MANPKLVDEVNTFKPLGCPTLEVALDYLGRRPGSFLTITLKVKEA